MSRFKWVFFVLVLLLGGCQVDLFHNLSQDEANQMVALLMLHHIDAVAESDGKTGSMKLTIDKSQFINAVELLRQNGYPKQHYSSVEELFPSGQLVTSPTQEQAKMNFLKEQQLEKTLSQMDGVISARVAIAEKGENSVSDNKSASVFIKYSPQANLTNAKNSIKALVKNAVTGLSIDNISVYMQESSYRYLAETPSKEQVTKDSFLQSLEVYKWPISAGLLFILVTCLGSIVWLRRSLGSGTRRPVDE